MTYGVLDVVTDLIQGNLEYVKPHIRDSRTRVCLSCDQRRTIPGTQVGRCNQCGCFLDAKSMLARASCPLGKWEK